MTKTQKLVWRTETRRVNDLLPYEKNPRTITDQQMEDLKNSLKKFNLAEIPAVNLDGKIVAGHQRIKALQLLGRGEEQIEVRIPNRKLSQNEFKQYQLREQVMKYKNESINEATLNRGKLSKTGKLAKIGKFTKNTGPV